MGRRCTLYPQRNEHRDALDLSGLWQFALDPDKVGEAAGWFTGLPSPRMIAVPGSWNEQFEDTRDYFGVAWYVTQVHIPRGWRDRVIWLRIGSANHAAKLWVNGSYLGAHVGGHLPFEFEIPPALLSGRPATVALRIENEPSPLRVPSGPKPAGPGAASFPELGYDFFPYSGLHRPVILYAVPARHIAAVAVVTSIDGPDGIIEATVNVAGAWSGRGRAQLEGERLPLAAEFQVAEGRAGVRLRVPEARFWGPNDPFLYTLRLALTDGAAEVDAYTVEVGIRTIEVSGDRLLLNGQPIRLRGFGKHEDFAVHGRGLDLPVLVKDYALLKWVGANSYRTSHYPHCEEAMRLADREGFLVIDEIPAVGLVFDDSDEAIAARLEASKQQLRELVARDKNHPSVLIWSLANEPHSGDGRARDTGSAFFRELFAEARALDPTRPVIIVGEEGAEPSWLELSDIVAINRYRGWYVAPGRLEQGMRQVADELDRLHATLGRPVVLTEFGADAIAGMHDEPSAMWSEEYQAELIRRYLEIAASRPWIIGTHVWTFADFKTAQSIRRPGGMNFKGVFTRDRQPKMAAHFLRSQWTGRT
jgi:beta-glucuronidase